MYKIKTSYYYLERGFPENLEPAFTNQSTKRKRFLVERKKKILKRAVRKGLRTLVKPFFSWSTKKGVLLEKSELFLQDVVTQVKEENLQKKGLISLPFSFSQKDLFSDNVFFSCKQKNQHQPQEIKESEKTRVDEKREQGIERKREISFLQRKKNSKQKKCKRYKFLFPLHRLKGELSKRESQYGKIELYKKQIQERKKLALIYGTIPKSSIKKLVKQARTLSSHHNPPAKVLVTLLESRLDVALFRASFFPSISMARQWINHNKVAVNQNKIRAPGYQLKGGDCIEISPTWASLLKEKMQQRINQILPFRGSRKKIVTPSLIDNWCSFERVFSGDHFSSSQNRGIKSQNLNIKGDKIAINPTLMQNFSSMRDHLQSIWEKSVRSPRSFSNFVGETQIKNNNHLYQRPSSSLRVNSKTLSFLVSDSSAGSGKEREEKSLSEKKWQKGSIPIYKTNRNSPYKAKRPPTKTSFFLQKGVILFARLKKKEVGTLDFLNAKKALIRPRNRAQKLAGLQVSVIKPLHLEVSYRLLTVIFLYSPQKLGYPGNLDFSLIMRSFK